MKKIFLPLILLAGIFLLAGCNNKEEETGYSINYINKDTTRLVEKGYRPHGNTTEELIDEFIYAAGRSSGSRLSECDQQ